MLDMLEKSLGSKIIFWVTLAFVCVFAFTTWFNISYQTSSSKTQIKESASLTCHSIMEALKALMLVGNQDLVQRAVDKVGEGLEGLSIVDWEGVIKRSSNPSLVNKKFQVQGLDAERVLKGKKWVGLRKNDKEKWVYTELLPITNDKECLSCHEAQFKVLGFIQADLDWSGIQKKLNQVVSSNIVSSLLGLAVIIALLIFMLRVMMVVPITKLIAAAAVLSSRTGDLTQKIAIFAKDEIGNLGGAFNKIIDSMHDMVFRVRDTAEKTASSAQELSSSTEELNAATQEIASVIQQVAKGVGTQSQRIEEIVHTAEKALVALKQMVANAQSASAAVNQTSTCAEGGIVSAQQAVDKIGLITNTVIETSKVIQGLGEKSQQIGEITETITSIADQTNLLALNAAIEAARAGEAGRGFAVVAEEVRKLAESSAEAVRKIGGLIRSIQTETSRAVGAIEASSKEVEEGRSQVSKIAEILADINKAAHNAKNFVAEISSAGQAQYQQTERIVKAINEVAEIAKEFAATSQEVSSSIEEQTASMEEISASAQELVRIAIDLKNMVDKFKLRPEKEGAKVKNQT